MNDRVRRFCVIQRVFPGLGVRYLSHSDLRRWVVDIHDAEKVVIGNDISILNDIPDADSVEIDHEA